MTVECYRATFFAFRRGRPDHPESDGFIKDESGYLRLILLHSSMQLLDWHRREGYELFMTCLGYIQDLSKVDLKKSEGQNRNMY